MSRLRSAAVAAVTTVAAVAAAASPAAAAPPVPALCADDCHGPVVRDDGRTYAVVVGELPPLPSPGYCPGKVIVSTADPYLCVSLASRLTVYVATCATGDCVGGEIPVAEALRVIACRLTGDSC